MSEMISINEKLPERECVVAVTLTDGSIKYRYYNPKASIRYPFGFSYINGALSWRDKNVISWRYIKNDEKYNLNK